MKALVTGAGGQVGEAWIAAAPADWAVVAAGRRDLDITDPAAVEALVADVRPDLILNAAAYTSVDRAESEPELAFAANRDGAGYLAAAARRTGARFIHISTDFVFDGHGGRPYRPNDVAAPAGVYGASKLAGEAAVMAENPAALIVRTAWVYGPHGANFLATMLRLMANQAEVGPELGVVADQIGTPTSTLTLAAALWGFAAADAKGLWHYTDAGAASWYDFAIAIAEEAVSAGVLESAPPIRPLTTADYPTPAGRPAYSVLDKTASFALLGTAPHWRVALRAVLQEMRRKPQ